MTSDCMRCRTILGTPLDASLGDAARGRRRRSRGADRRADASATVARGEISAHWRITPPHSTLGLRVRPRVDQRAGDFLQAARVGNAHTGARDPESQCVATTIRRQCAQRWHRQRFTSSMRARRRRARVQSSSAALPLRGARLRETAEPTPCQRSRISGNTLPAQIIAIEALVGIGVVVDPTQLVLARPLFQLGARTRQQRPGEPAAARMARAPAWRRGLAGRCRETIATARSRADRLRDGPVSRHFAGLELARQQSDIAHRAPRLPAKRRAHALDCASSAPSAARADDARAARQCAPTFRKRDAYRD